MCRAPSGLPEKNKIKRAIKGGKNIYTHTQCFNMRICCAA